MARTSTARVIRFRQRRRTDRVCLMIEANRIELRDTLQAAGVLDPCHDDDNETLTTGIEKLLAKLQEKIP